MKNSKKGFSLVELGGYIVIIAIIGSIVGLAVSNMIKNSKDTVTMSDLRALSDATELYMADTNDVSPCFSPEVGEGTATATGICADSGYDYVQGRLAEDLNGDSVLNQNLDGDILDGEAYTFDNILTPDYIKTIPSPAIKGNTYFYTTGKPDANPSSSAFAYSARLSGGKAKDKTDVNISVLNTLGVTGFANSDLNPTCTTGDIAASGTGTALTLGNQSDGTTALINTGNNAYNYYTVSQLSNNGGTAGALVKGTTACDLWSAGKGLINGNFSDTQSGASNSVTVSVNALN